MVFLINTRFFAFKKTERRMTMKNSFEQEICKLVEVHGSAVVGSAIRKLLSQYEKPTSNQKQR
jgi:hypothetical protein